MFRIVSLLVAVSTVGVLWITTIREALGKETDARWHRSTGRERDVRRRTGDVRRRTGDVRRRTGDVRRRTGDVRRRTGDVRRRTGDVRRRTRTPRRSIDVRRIFSRFRFEPGVAEVQRRAVRFACAGSRKIRSWQRRVRVAPLLPEVRVGMDRSRAVDFSLKVEPGTPNLFNRGLDTGYTWGVQLKWSLNRLIFDADELKVSREAQRLTELREEVTDQVTRLYFERRRLQVLHLITPPRTVRSAVFRQLALQRLTAALDAMTGGWFKKEVGRRSRRRTSGVRRRVLKARRLASAGK